MNIHKIINNEAKINLKKTTPTESNYPESQWDTDAPDMMQANLAIYITPI